MKKKPRPEAAVADKARRALQSYSRDQPYLIGVSGGRDSIALLHLLREAGFRKMTVCHLDHRLRADSGADAEFVADIAGQWGCAAVMQKADVAALARRQKISLETAARNARRRFFAQTAQKRGIGAIFLGHHADDQVETFLFNLLRGAGAAGLSGMRVESSLRNDGSVRALRPLLGFWRTEIDSYVNAHQLPFREDASNADSRHTRNRLRNTIIPFLEREMNRNVRECLWRAANILMAEDRWLDALVASDGAARLSVKKVRELPLAHQRRLARRWLLVQDAPAPSFDEVEELLLLVENGSKTAKMNLACGWHLRRRAGWLFLERPTKTKSTQRTMSDEEC